MTRSSENGELQISLNNEQSRMNTGWNPSNPMTALDATNRSKRPNHHQVSWAERSSKLAGYGQGTFRVQSGNLQGPIRVPVSTKQQVRYFCGLKCSGSRATRLKSNLMPSRQGKITGPVLRTVRLYSVPPYLTLLVQRTQWNGMGESRYSVLRFVHYRITYRLIPYRTVLCVSA